MSPLQTSPTESELLELANRIAHGDTGAENRLVKLYTARVRSMAMRRTRDPEAAKEIVDDVMMGTIQALRRGKVREPGRLGAFVYGTAVKLISNYERSRRRRPITEELMNDFPGLDTAEIMEANSDFDHIVRGIEQLESDDREVLRFLVVDGMSLGEVAIRLGLTAGAVRQRKSRALKHLKAHFDEPRKL
jgi:RNA polymerase sigma-70 factor (ECF subfamily)